MLRFFIVYGRPAIYVAGSSPETCWAWQRGADRFERDAEAPLGYLAERRRKRRS